MIVGLGIDFLDNRRFERELRRGRWLARDGVFTAREIRQCDRGCRPRRYAACFVAKEATLKALGVAVNDLAWVREVEVYRRADGKAIVVLHRRPKEESERLGARRIRLSIASTRHHSGAMVILES